MKNLTAFCLCVSCVLAAASGHAIDLKQSKITQVVNDVQIISAADQAQKHATINDVFSMPDVLRTGAASRAELVAADQTITRVGANTIFSFDPANRTLDLKQGSLLFHAPHGKGGGSIHTGSATASVLGTTLIVVTTPNGGFKVIALEGEVEVKFLNGLKQKLDPGQMTYILPGANQLAPVIIFRLDELTQNSLLVKGFQQPLASTPLINAAIQGQNNQIRHGNLVQTPYYAGDNATQDQVEVLDVNTVGTGSSLDTADATINKPSLTDPSIGPNHVSVNKPFSILNNTYFANDTFVGFLARNIFVNTLSGTVPLDVDLSPYAALPEFDIVAANNFYIKGPVVFQGLSGSSVLGLIAGNQFIFTPGVSLSTAAGDLFMASPASLTLNKVTLANLSGNIDLQIGSDINIQNLSQVNAAGNLSIFAAGKISANNSTLSGNSVSLTAGNGNVALDSTKVNAAQAATLAASASMTINNSTISGGSTIVATAPGGINITGTSETGTSLNTDPAGGSIILASGKGSINVSGTSITTYALTLNSGDGILLDGSGHTFTASGSGGNASFTAQNSTTLQHADFSSFASVNVAAQTINLFDVNLPGSGTLKSSLGQWFNGNGGFGYINDLGGVTIGGTTPNVPNGFSGTIPGTSMTVGKLN